MKKLHLQKKNKKNLRDFFKAIYNIITLNFLDKKIENILKKNLHKKKTKYLNRAIKNFSAEHPEVDSAQLDNLREMLIKEMDRSSYIADKSILRAGIKRAKLVFLATFIVTAIIIGVIAAVTHGAGIAFLPLLTPVVAWVVTIATIPLLYNERIVGSMDSVLHNFELSLLTEQNKNININSLDHEKNSTKDLLQLLINVEINATNHEKSENMNERSMDGIDWLEEKVNMYSSFYQSPQNRNDSGLVESECELDYLRMK